MASIRTSRAQNSVSTKCGFDTVRGSGISASRFAKGNNSRNAMVLSIPLTLGKRVSCTTGIPPPLVPDTYSREQSGKTADNLLDPSVVFEKQLSVVHIGESSSSKDMDLRHDRTSEHSC